MIEALSPGLAPAIREAYRIQREINRVRLAVPADLPGFAEAFRAFLVEAHRRERHDVLPTPKSVAFFASLAERYVASELTGACVLLVGDDGKIKGFSLAGEAPAELPWDSAFGRRAYGWGTWVKVDWRGKGWGARLALAAHEELRRLGIETLLGGISTKKRESELARIGFEIYQWYGMKRL